MTTEEFNTIKSNAPAVRGAECEFVRYYHGSGRHEIERGIIVGFSDGVFEIAQAGKRLSIYYTGVTIIK